MSIFTYRNAIFLLGEYSKNKRYYVPGLAARFFTGAWNRHNVDAVEAVLEIHNPYREGKFNDYKNPLSEESKITLLLNDLKAQLMKSGAPINPHGALSMCIDKIQAGSKLSIINVYTLNKEIKSNNTSQEPVKVSHARAKGFTYISAIHLLGQYSGNQPYYAKGWEGAARFFSGAWIRNNVDAVEAVLNSHDPHGLHEGKFNDYKNPQSEEDKIEALLTDLKNQLITEGNEINPDGELAKIINRIQIQSNTNVIDIDDLNAEIKQNKFTF